MSTPGDAEHRAWAEALLRPLLDRARANVEWSTARRMRAPSGHLGKLAGIEACLQALGVDCDRQ